MTNIILKMTIADDKADALIDALKNYGEIIIEDDNETVSLDDALVDIFPGLSPEQIAGMMLKEARTDKNMTQEDLAKELGTSASAISAMESGTRTISRETAKKLGEFFNMDYKAFL